MSLEFIGLIGPQESSESQAPRGPLVDLEFIKAFSQAQEYGGFDKALLAVNTSAPDSMILASYVAALTERIGLLVAHRPGFQAPTFAARQFATLDQLSGAGHRSTSSPAAIAATCSAMATSSTRMPVMPAPMSTCRYCATPGPARSRSTTWALTTALKTT